MSAQFPVTSHSDTPIAKPAMVSIPLTQPFWAAAAEGTLLLQRCLRCTHIQHYPRTLCARCWSIDLEWTAAQGMGAIWTFTVVSMPGHPAWNAETPYVLALVELDEGPRVLTNIVGCDPDRVAVGQRVSLVPHDDPRGNPSLLQFELADTQNPD
jgi:Predicted nucleic-acid-binding protein containing a Zn-ribbon